MLVELLVAVHKRINGGIPLLYQLVGYYMYRGRSHFKERESTRLQLQLLLLFNSQGISLDIIMGCGTK